MTPADYKKLPCVLVCWADITSHHGGSWFRLHDFGEAAECFTWGVIIREDSNNLYMTSSLSFTEDDSEGSGDSTIPKGCVKWIKSFGTRWASAPTDRTKNLLPINYKRKPNVKSKV